MNIVLQSNANNTSNHVVFLLPHKNGTPRLWQTQANIRARVAAKANVALLKIQFQREIRISDGVGTNKP